MKEFYYKAYGLKILSDIFFPEFVGDTCLIPDITIRYGTVPVNVLQAKISVANCQIATDQFLIKLPGIANYFVANGTTIIVEPYLVADENTIRFYLTGIIMGMVLHQRRLLVLHASAIAVANGAIAFVAASGRGKSTLAAAFYQRGFSILADDICAINIASNAEPTVYSGFPQIKLSKASINKLNIPENTVEKLPSKKEKYSFSTKKNFIDSSKSLLHIYELTFADTEDISLNYLTGIEKFTTIMQHTFNEWAIPALGLQTTHFTLCALLNKHINLSRVIRPLFDFKIDELTEFLLDDFEKNRCFHSQSLDLM